MLLFFLSVFSFFYFKYHPWPLYVNRFASCPFVACATLKITKNKQKHTHSHTRSKHWNRTNVCIIFYCTLRCSFNLQLRRLYINFLVEWFGALVTCTVITIHMVNCTFSTFINQFGHLASAASFDSFYFFFIFILLFSAFFCRNVFIFVIRSVFRCILRFSWCLLCVCELCSRVWVPFRVT